MEVISESAGHKFHFRLGKWPASVFGVPTAINGDLTQRKTGGESCCVRIDHGLQTEPAANFCAGTKPLIAHLQSLIMNTAQIEISAPPQAAAFRFDRLIDQSSGNRRRWPVQACDQ